LPTNSSNWILKKKDGNELDEFLSHKFLESLGETLTVIALREKLRKIDLDANGKMALLEYLCFKYSKTVKAVCSAPQGSNVEELKAAQAMVEGAQKALNDERIAEEALKKSEAELRVAVDDLKAQEDAYHNQIAALERKSTDTASSVVSRNKAANELAQLKSENPMPLRKAKITQEAALRKVEKERKAAEQATLNAEQKVSQAEQYLEEVKQRGGGDALGAIWWMQRDLKEAQRFLPQKKQN